MNPLTLRKHLLIAESELNRSHLIEDLGVLKAGACAVAGRYAAILSVVPSLTGLVGMVGGWVGAKKAKPSGPSTLWRWIVLGARLTTLARSILRPPKAP